MERADLRPGQLIQWVEAKEVKVDRLTDLTGADMAGLMTQMNQQQTQLQAAFMILARLSNLTLLNELH